MTLLSSSPSTSATAAPEAASSPSSSVSPDVSPGVSPSVSPSVSIGDDLLSAGRAPRNSTSGPTRPGRDTSSPEASPKGAIDPSDAPSDDPSDVERLERWVERLHVGIDRLAEVAVPRLLRLQSGLRATGGQVRRQAGLVREDGEAWAESVRCTVREHPVKAIAVAAAFGLLLARLSR